ncbi:MAG: hypothetical protein IT269_04915 [Saprospiraceae bacterium]|nr:hypothetical protein [Saprospiraceae bacterium]
MKNSWLIFGLCFWLIYGCQKSDTWRAGEWRQLTTPDVGALMSVDFCDSLHGVAVGGHIWHDGAILSTNDGGQHWQIDTIVRNRLDDVRFQPDGTAYTCGVDGLGFFATPNQPNSWTLFRQDWIWYRSLAFPSPKHCIAVSGEGWGGGSIRHFSLRGWWQEDRRDTFPSALQSICFSDSNTAHVVGMGWVARSDDGGQNWTRLDIEGDFYRCVQFPTASTGYICGSSGSILKSTDGGHSWQEIRKTGGKIRLLKLFFTDENNGYLVGAEGLFWITEDGGETWEQVEGISSDLTFTDVFANRYGAWATTTDGRLYFLKK